MERADGLLRVMRTNYILSLDKGVNTALTWRPVLEIFTHSSKEEIDTIENDTGAALRLLLLDSSNMNSLKIILTRARENARGVQDHITKEVWEQVNQMYHMVNHPTLASRLTGHEALETIENFSKNSLLFIGITDTTMPRGLGWSFMNLGRYIERCTQTNEIADKQYGNINYDLKVPVDITEWRYLLLSLSGFELHLKTYRSSNYNKNVLHQVLINQDFTRSVFYSLIRIDRYLEDVISETRLAGTGTLQRFFGKLFSEIKYLDFDSLDGMNLQQCLAHVRHNMLDFSKYLAQNFFSYS